MLALCSAASLPCVASPRARSGRTACAARAPLRTAYARCMAPCGLVLAAPGAPHVQLGVATTRRRLVVLAASSTGNQELVKDSDFSITKVSFGSIGLSVGLTLLVAGFLGYFGFVGGRGADNSLSALLLIYGFPISLIGFALKYAELKPLVCESYADAVALRETQATPILLQVRSDVTRFRYGDEQHLDEALLRIFRINKAGGIRRTQAPVLARLREEVTDGKYTLVLGFDSKMEFEEWETRRSKFESFFGPGVSAVLIPSEKGVDVALISDGSAAGGISDDMEMLPPLMPGLQPRVRVSPEQKALK